MLLRNSISNTKKFIQKTLDNFKSLLSKGNMYERLPKTPTFHPFSCGRDATDIDIETGYKDLDNFYSEFTHQWDSSNKAKMKNKGQKKAHFSATQKTQEEFYAEKSQKIAQEIRHNAEEFCSENHAERREIVKISKRQREFTELCSRSVRERRLCSVAEKLKELMDEGSVDQKMDVEEVLHYYSRLTCPAYLDIVDKFFMEMCVEFYGSQASNLAYSTPK